MTVLNPIDLNEKEENLVVTYFSELKNERAKYVHRWRDIQKYVAITNNVSEMFEDTSQEYKQKDEYINDSTGFKCTNQAGDYLAGILWSDVSLEPSEYAKKKCKGADYSEFYKKCTNVFLQEMNATDAGFQTILKSYCYDQFSFGTSGIGVFRSKEFDNQQSESCLNFKTYGVWNSCIDEGVNNKINVIFTVYDWRLNQIIDEFCYDGDDFNKQSFDLLPDDIKKSYEKKELNKRFKIVCGIMPNSLYNLNKIGKNGSRFKGYWFLQNDNKIFRVEYFKELPVAICRAIRVNGQIYGESSGTLCISAIKMLNYITGKTIDNAELRTSPPIGMYSGALAQGNVIDYSPNSVTTFNAKAAGDVKTPIFPLIQASDISAITNFIIPALKSDITNVFKIDQLLDFNNQTQMTATESSMRMSIRGKSINGLLTQEKTECIEPVCHRSISIIQDCGKFGYILDKLPEQTIEDIQFKQYVIDNNEYVPTEIAEIMNEGKRWYVLRFKGELEKLLNVELYEALGKFLQYLDYALKVKPDLINAINDYEFLDLLKNAANLNNEGLVKTKNQYNTIIQQIEESRQAQAQQEQAMAQSQIGMNVARANKDEAQSYAV
nr:MAG TPA: head to tail connecting protein [Caudoviricetes sp.]